MVPPIKPLIKPNICFDLADEQNGTDPFEEFYGAYPKKVAKQDARKAWQATAKHRPPNDELLAKLAMQKKHNWRDTEKQFIPGPATWLRKHRWEDEIIKKKTVNGTKRSRFEVI